MDNYVTPEKVEAGSEVYAYRVEDGGLAQPEPLATKPALGCDEWPPYHQGPISGLWTHAPEPGGDNSVDRGQASANSRSRRKPLTWFDPGVDFQDPIGDTFTRTILDLLPKRTGPGKRVPFEELYERVRAVLANGLRLHYHRTSPAVAHNRSCEKRGRAPVWPTGPAMADITNLLERNEFLALDVHPMKRKASFYSVTDFLLEWAAELGMSRAYLTKRLKDQDIIRLYGPKPKRMTKGARAKGERIDFVHTDQTNGWLAELKAYNDFVSAHAIELDLSAEELAEWAVSLNKDDDVSGIDFRMPELLQTDLCRIFNNGVLGSVHQAFDQGGRFYGGWWINAPSRFRPRITIDGRPTVELDYSGYHINMIYHEHGLECEGEPYELPDIAASERQHGLRPGTFRSCIKQYTQALINCDKGGRPSQIDLEEGTELPPLYGPSRIIEMIEHRHRPIAKAFRTNAGLRLQRIDSDIAMEVITTAMNEGWVALPVHDSFIAPTEHRDRLLSIMHESYTKRFGYVIHIKEKS